MSLSALNLVKSACYELNEAVPATLFGSTDSRALQLLNILYAVGRDLRGRKEWLQLKKTYSFTTTAATSYTLPADFYGGLFESGRNDTKNWSLDGPVSDSDFNFLADGYLTGGVGASFRIFGLPGTNQFQFLPATDTGSLILFDYVSSNWIKTGASTWQEAISADSDTCVFDDDLMILGIKWKWKQMKGLDSTELHQEYEDKITRAFMRFKGGRRVSLMVNNGLSAIFNSPEGSFR